MTQTIHIPPNERHVIRVFQVLRSREELKSGTQSIKPTQELAAELLGNGDVNRHGLELFPVSDLVGVGLSGYLVDGHGLSNEVVAPQALILDQVDGYVLLVFSSIFGPDGGTLDLSEDLVLVGTFAGEATDWEPGQPIETDSALPHSGQTGKKRPSDAAMAGRVAMVALLVLFLLTAIIVWIA